MPERGGAMHNQRMMVNPKAPKSGSSARARRLHNDDASCGA
jgi:hypothetical protein